MTKTRQVPPGKDKQPLLDSQPAKNPRDLNYVSPKRDEWPYWCQHFRIDEETLEQATHAVGYAVMDLEIWLENKQPKNRS